MSDDSDSSPPGSNRNSPTNQEEEEEEEEEEQQQCAAPADQKTDLAASTTPIKNPTPKIDKISIPQSLLVEGDKIQDDATRAPDETMLQKKRKRDDAPPSNKINKCFPLSNSSSSSSDEDEDRHHAPRQQAKAESQGRADSPQPQSTSGQQHNIHRHDGWRVKLYRLNELGSWDDCGTGRILCLYKQPKEKEGADNVGEAWIYQELGEPTLCMHSELHNQTNRILLRTRILLRDAYQRQGDNIITWSEPCFEEGNPTQGVDLALSFQDNAGCLDIWRQITQVQSRAADLFRRTQANNMGPGSSSSIVSQNSGSGDESEDHDAPPGSSVADVAHAVAAAHHAKLQRQQQQDEMNHFYDISQAAAQHRVDPQRRQQQEQHFEDAMDGIVASYQDTGNSPQLPNPPSLGNLEEVADMIAAVQHIQQRESLALFISQNECSYLKSLLSLFPSAEAREDFGSLATLAACIKTILLLNDPSIIELIVSDELIFEEVCSTLEYDPDLRDKANHRWFLRERAKFRTVALMEDEDLVAAIHRSFRVNYLRDTLLRPTMDESSLSTLSSLQTFTHADVVKGVTQSPVPADDRGELLKDSYLAKIIRMLGRELHTLAWKEWDELEQLSPGTNIASWLDQSYEEPAVDRSTVVASGRYPQSQEMSTTWKQHLAPQDGSLESRRLRRRGCLAFLRELFNMVRTSLQQNDKDDFFAVLVSMEVDIGGEESESPRDSSRQQQTETKGFRNKTSHSPRPVNLLSLLGAVLSDPNTDVTEKSGVLEIIAGIAIHDPSLIRRRCIDYYSFQQSEKESRALGRPNPNEKKQLIFHCPPHDLLASLLFLLAVETDAGILLQVSEIMRIILDTDMMGDHGPIFSDDAEGLPPSGTHPPAHEQHSHPGSTSTSTDQNQFLSMFYEHYVPWLTAPFQYIILHPIRRVPDGVLLSKTESRLFNTIIRSFEKGEESQEMDSMLRAVPGCAIRYSFNVELMSFCVRAHLYRMKCYLLRSRVLGSVLKLLNSGRLSKDLSDDRCLKLAVLRFLRSVLSVNDEFYHRHIIQHDLFAPVFDSFRANPVGDNLVSSAIVEMCDYIHSENIKSLIEYVVTKHLSSSTVEKPVPSLEDVSSPYVNTLTILRKAYEKNLKSSTKAQKSGSEEVHVTRGEIHSRYFHENAAVRSARLMMNEKALEDQRKFREADEEESYFEADEDEGSNPSTSVPPAVDEVAAQDGESELHRAPRMFSLPQSSLLKQAQLREESKAPLGASLIGSQPGSQKYPRRST